MKSWEINKKRKTMKKENYKDHTIKQKRHSIGFAMMTTYDVLNNNKLLFNACTVREAKEKIDNLTKGKTL
jgi:hypothetical protein